METKREKASAGFLLKITRVHPRAKGILALQVGARLDSSLATMIPLDGVVSIHQSQNGPVV
jgi:hypothetical protein